MNESEPTHNAERPAPPTARMANLLNQGAELYLELAQSEQIRRQLSSQAEIEKEIFDDSYDTSPHLTWIAEVAGTYLFESAHELMAIAALLQKEQITASIEVLVRAVVERCGRIVWILDNDESVSPDVRAARVTLEIANCSQHYRRSLRSLYPESSNEVRRATSELQALRNSIDGWFSDISKVPRNNSESGVESKDVADWIILGQQYPTFEKLALWAFTSSDEPKKNAVGTYAILSSFSHPSVVANREHREIVDGRLTYSYEVDYICRLCGNALASFFNSLKHWIAYFDFTHDKTVEKINSLQDKWDDLHSYISLTDVAQSFPGKYSVE